MSRTPSPQIIARRAVTAAQAMGLAEGSYTLHVDPGGGITITPLTMDQAAGLSAANDLDWIQGCGDGQQRRRRKRGATDAP